MKITSAYTGTVLSLVLTSVGYAQQAYYGIVGTSQIWGIDVNTGVNTQLTNAPFIGSGAHANALAFDQGFDRLIYQQDFGQPGLQTSQPLYYYNFATGTNQLLSPAGTAARQASNATFFQNRYWWIESNTDNLWSSAINYTNNTYSNPVFQGNVVGDASPMDFGDIVFDGSGNLLISGGESIAGSGPNGPKLRLFNPNTLNFSVNSNTYLGQIAKYTNQFGTDTYYTNNTGNFLRKFNPSNGNLVPGYSFAMVAEPSDLAIRNIPEPSTTGLLALAGSLCLIRRRRA